jgi:CDP-diacylglycerol--glycerol-3-phosphate 3-phosphatidyltransferase
MDRLTSAPNLLTVSRILASPVLLVAAVTGAADIFLAVLIYALLSDAIDGRLARATGHESTLGAQLDSWADCLLYLTTPIGVVLLLPWMLSREWATLATIVASYVVPITAGVIRYRRLTAYHTVAAKVSGTLLSAAGVWLIATGDAWPLRVAAGVLVISAAEELAITRVLPQWRANVPSLRAARRLRTESTRNHDTRPPAR